MHGVLGEALDGALDGVLEQGHCGGVMSVNQSSCLVTHTHPVEFSVVIPRPILFTYLNIFGFCGNELFT